MKHTLIILIFFSVFLNSCSFTSVEKRPNIVFIVSEQIHTNDFSLQKSKVLQTSVYNNFISNSVGLEAVNSTNIYEVLTTNTELQEILKANGYQTTIFKQTDSGVNSCKLLKNEAINFINHSHEKPFYCLISFKSIEYSKKMNINFFNKYKRLGCIDSVANEYAIAEIIDVSVGQVLETISSLGISENTIIVWMESPKHKGDSNSALIDNLYAPFFIRFPRKLKNSKQINEQITDVDILPTVLELCEIEITNDLKIKGNSLVPFLLSDDKIHNVSSNSRNQN